MNLKFMLFSTLFSAMGKPLECEATCERKQGIKYRWICHLKLTKIPCNDKGL